MRVEGSIVLLNVNKSRVLTLWVRKREGGRKREKRRERERDKEREGGERESSQFRDYSQNEIRLS